MLDLDNLTTTQMLLAGGVSLFSFWIGKLAGRISAADESEKRRIFLAINAPPLLTQAERDEIIQSARNYFDSEQLDTDVEGKRQSIRSAWIDSTVAMDTVNLDPFAPNSVRVKAYKTLLWYETLKNEMDRRNMVMNKIKE